MSIAPLVSRRALRASWLGLLLALPMLPPHGRKLNGPLARLVRTDVTDFQVSSDGTRAVYLADRDQDDVFELYSRALQPDAPALRLNAPLPAGGDVRAGFRIDPRDRWVVFLADGGVDEKVELYAAPLDGSAPALRLSQPGLASGDVVAFGLDPTGQRVVFLADLATDEQFELFSVPLDGPPIVLRLNTPLATGGDVLDFEISPDGNRVAFRADAVDHIDELFSARIDQSQAATRLDPTLPSGGDVEPGYAFVADGSAVVYRADQDVNDDLELYLVPAAGGAPHQLSSALVAGGDVTGFALAPDGTRLAYRADQESDELFELYGVALAGGVPVKLEPTLAPDRGVAPELAISADSARVVFRADATVAGVEELFSAPLDASAPAARLDDPALVAGSVGVFGVSGTRAAFLAPAVSGGVQLFSAPLDGLGPVLELAGPIVDGGDVSDFALAGPNAVFRADRDRDEVLELYRVALDGSHAAEKLHRDLPHLLNVLPGYRIDAAGSRVLYLADATQGEVFELFETPLAGAPETSLVSESLRGVGAVVGRVSSFRVLGSRAVYLSDTLLPGVRELYSVPVNGSERPRRLSDEPVPGASVQFDLFPSPDETRILYFVDQDVDQHFELYSVPVDGSARAVKLNGALPAGDDVARSLAITPDSRTVVYVADHELDGQFELYSVPIEGGSAPLRLDPALHLYSDALTPILVSPDSAYAYYRADRVVRDKHELFRVPVDGSAPPRQLSALAAPGGDVQSRMQLSPDGTRLVYEADSDENDRFEIYSVPSDGSAPPVKLDGPLVHGGDVLRFAISADGTRVLYLADQEVDHRIEFYSAPIDGSAAPAKFFGATPASVTNFQTTRDGQAVFLATFSFLEGRDLYVAPVDASAPPRRVNDPVLARRSVDNFGLTPDGKTAVYVAAQVRGPDVWVVPLDGSLPPRRITSALHGRDPIGFALTLDPQGEHVLFEVHLGNRFTRDLYLAPLDGSAPPLHVNPDIPVQSFLQVWAFTPRGDAVIYLGDVETPARTELFATFFDPQAMGAPRLR